MVKDSEPQDKHPEGLTENQEHLLNEMFKKGLVRFGNFTWALHENNPETPLAPIYINLRDLQRFTTGLKKDVVSVYEDLIKGQIGMANFSLLAGVPIAATPLTSSLADKLGRGMLTPRIESKTHGTGAKVDGFQESDVGKKEVLLVDDVLTVGGSKERAIEILENVGYGVVGIAILLDYELGGKEKFEGKGYRVLRAFTVKQMLNFCVRVGKLTQEQLGLITERLGDIKTYLKQNA